MGHHIVPIRCFVFSLSLALSGSLGFSLCKRGLLWCMAEGTNGPNGVWGSEYLSLSFSLYLSIHQSIYLPIYPSTYLPIYLSIYLSTHLPIYLSIYLSVCPTIGRFTAVVTNSRWPGPVCSFADNGLLFWEPKTASKKTQDVRSETANGLWIAIVISTINHCYWSYKPR